MFLHSLACNVDFGPKSTFRIELKFSVSLQAIFRLVADFSEKSLFAEIMISNLKSIASCWFHFAPTTTNIIFVLWKIHFFRFFLSSGVCGKYIFHQNFIVSCLFSFFLKTANVLIFCEKKNTFTDFLISCFLQRIWLST